MGTTIFRIVLRPQPESEYGAVYATDSVTTANVKVAFSRVEVRTMRTIPPAPSRANNVEKAGRKTDCGGNPAGPGTIWGILDAGEKTAASRVVRDAEPAATASRT